VAARQFSGRSDLIRGVDGTQFRGLGQAQDARFGVMDVAPFDDGLLNGLQIQFAVRAGDVQDFGAIGEKFRGAAFIGFHVGQFVADDAVIGAAERCQGQGVGGRAVEYEENLAIGFEGLADTGTGLLGPDVVAVGGDEAPVGLIHGLPRFGTNAGIVVAGKLIEDRVLRIDGSGRHGIPFSAVFARNNIMQPSGLPNIYLRKMLG